MVYKLFCILLNDLLIHHFRNIFIWCRFINRSYHKVMHNDRFKISLNKRMIVSVLLEELFHLSPPLGHPSYTALCSRGSKTVGKTVGMCGNSTLVHHLKNCRNWMRVLVLPLLTHLEFIPWYFTHLLHHQSIKWE